MDGVWVWILGVVACAVVAAAFVWVLRHRDDAVPTESPHGYGPPDVALSDSSGRSATTFGSGPGLESPVDETVPLSRLGGAGWRDGGGVAVATNAGYAGESRPWDGEDAVDGDTGGEPVQHITVDDSAGTLPDVEQDRRRGGHW